MRINECAVTGSENRKPNDLQEHDQKNNAKKENQYTKHIQKTKA